MHSSYAEALGSSLQSGAEVQVLPTLTERQQAALAHWLGRPHDARERELTPAGAFNASCRQHGIARNYHPRGALLGSLREQHRNVLRGRLMSTDPIGYGSAHRVRRLEAAYQKICRWLRDV